MKNHPDIQLGEKTEYPREYNPKLLYAIPRRGSRETLGIFQPLPFEGVDIWNAYELSWLNQRGLPQVAIGEIHIPCDSEFIVESKSLKLYLNSINQTVFTSIEKVTDLLSEDISVITNSNVTVKLFHPSQIEHTGFNQYAGICLDDLNVEIEHYDIQDDYLRISEEQVEESVHSHLLKSNCPVTDQPDWATIQIDYTGNQIDHKGLLQYIVSFRNHNGFHENCVERIFTTIMKTCTPKKLSVYARYTRRGGLDINPFRSNDQSIPDNLRDPRQ